MGDTKFTPGPWEWVTADDIDLEGDGIQGWCIVGKDNEPVLWRKPTDGIDGNAVDVNLILAAPELYGACEYLFREGLKHGGNLSITGLRGLEGALAKARGEKVPDPSELDKAITAAGAKARGEA